MFPTISTPAIVVDLDIAEANIDRYQAYCDQHGLKVRPHIKTHKLPRLAKRQIAAGAIGLTCQKISEAEAMIAGGGVEDVLLTYNILGAEKLERLSALAKTVNLSVVADNEVVVAGLAAKFTEPDRPLGVFVECDTGANRCGVQSKEHALVLARLIEQAPGLTFEGLMTYPPAGHVNQVADWLGDAKSYLEEAGLTIRHVSGGGSPDMWHAHQNPHVTDYRIGTYIYNDRSLVERGVCEWSDCALTVLATVVSTPTSHRAIIDAGSKVLTSDLLGLDGYGHVLGRPELKIDQLSEEHGRIISDIPHGLSVGERVRIVPNHCCVVSNMLEKISLVRGETFLNEERVTARGLVW